MWPLRPVGWIMFVFVTGSFLLPTGRGRERQRKTYGGYSCRVMKELNAKRHKQKRHNFCLIVKQQELFQF